MYIYIYICIYIYIYIFVYIYIYILNCIIAYVFLLHGDELISVARSLFRRFKLSRCIYPTDLRISPQFQQCPASCIHSDLSSQIMPCRRSVGTCWYQSANDTEIWWGVALKSSSIPQFSRDFIPVSINGGTPKWLVYSGKSHKNG